MGRKRFLVLAVALVMLFGFAQVAGAALADPAWVTTDTQSNVYTLSFISSELNLKPGWTFGVYDYGSHDTNTGVALLSSSISSATFYTDSSGLVYNNSDPENWNTLTLTFPGQFGFYFDDGTSKYTNYSYTEVVGNQWSISSEHEGSGGPVQASDVAPVPLPASALFLFSGLVGLVAFGSRRKIMR